MSKSSMLVPTAANRQNQILSRVMSEFQTQQQAAPTDGPLRDAAASAEGQSGWLIALGIALSAALMLLVLLSSGSREPFLLILLAILAMIGVFFLFGLAAGHIRLGERTDAHQLSLIAVDALADAVQVTDADGTSLYTNRAFRNLVGAAADDEPATLQDLFIGEAAATGALFRLSRAAERGEVWAEEFKISGRMAGGTADLGGRAKRDGQRPGELRERWYRLFVRPQTQEDGGGAIRKLAVWHLADISSERARARQGAQNLRQELDGYDSLPIGMMQVSANGAIEKMNNRLAAWLGHDEALRSGRKLSLRDIAGPERAADILQFLKQDQDPNGVATPGQDIDLRDAAGEMLPVELLRPVDLRTPGDQGSTGKPGAGQAKSNGNAGPWRVAVVQRGGSLAFDEDAESSQLRLSQLLQTAPFGVATVDDTGRIIANNKLFERMFRTDRARPKGTIAKLLPRSCDPAARKKLIKSLQEVANQQLDLAPVDITFGAKGEHSRRIFIMPFSGGSGSSDSGETAILYVIDTTEQKALELKFAQSQKMEALGQLAGGIAHDFNNVLTVILGLSDLFMQTRRPTDPGYNDMMQIRSNGHRAAGMVRQLLAFSRKQTLSTEVLTLNDVVQDLGYSLGRLLGERIELKMHCQRNLWYLDADQTQLEQVVINLAVNARDAMPDGGRLTIRTKNISERDSRKLTDRGMVPGEYVMLEVKDAGHGMSEEVAGKIFEPFYSTKDVGKGTGLGLSTVYGIVKQTGGYIYVDSKPGKGASFKVYLPRCEDEPLSADKNSGKATVSDRPRDLTGSGCVLLVEDEDGVRSFASQALKRQGYEVLEAASGVEALEVMAQNEARVDIVVSDVVMPEMDGPSLLTKLRQTSPDLKFIFMSGYPDDAFAKGIDASANYGFLAKPFTLQQLAAKVKEELDG